MRDKVIGAVRERPSPTTDASNPEPRTPNPKLEFDYEDETIIQGRGGITATERTLGGLRLRRAYDAIAGMTGRCLLLGCGAGRHNRAIHRDRPDLDLIGVDLSVRAIRE